MKENDNVTPRLVIPRRTVLAGALVGLAAGPAFAQASGEGGEGAATAGLDPDVVFLTELGFFDATHRIVGVLYAGGHVATAQEHLELSHHAAYDDLSGGLARHGIASFADAAAAFASAVRDGAGADAVARAQASVLVAIEAAASALPAEDRIKAAEALVRTAAGDYAAGVAGGHVGEAQEYRDAWGFAETAKAMLSALAASGDAGVANAGRDALAALEPAEALFPALTAVEVPGADPAILYGAAARIEIIGLRLN